MTHQPNGPPRQTPGTPLTQANLARHQKQFREVRQFGCRPCGERTWWKKVAAPQFLSRCRSCRRRYEAIPVEQQHGHGVFECSCGHRWTNSKANGALAQDCKQCGAMVDVLSIGPPRRQGPRRSAHRHSCSGCATGACRFTFVESRAHQSTGGTISTSSSVRTLASITGSPSVEDISAALKKLALKL